MTEPRPTSEIQRRLVALALLIALVSCALGVGLREAWGQRARLRDAVSVRLVRIRDHVLGGPTQTATLVVAHTEVEPSSTSTWAPSASPEPTSSPSAKPTLSRRQELVFPLVKRGGAKPSSTPQPKPTETRRPSPTATPTLPWPDALPVPGNSKLGLHVQWNNSPEIMEFVRRMKPAVVKAVGDFGFVAELKQVSPETIVVGRVECSPALDGDAAQAARAFVAQHIETYRLNPYVDYWEGVNEPQMGDRMEWFAAFEAERCLAMAENGFRAAIGAFSAGTPEFEQFERFVPAVEAAKRHGGILTVHEYDAPTLERSAGAGLPGHPNYPHRGALALRYRWWYEDILIPRDLVVPLVISEVGVDGWIGNRPGPEGRGWQDFAEHWVDQGLAASGIEAYLTQLNWYDEQLGQDDYVIGCAIFTAGAMGDDWSTYDITHILRHIATEIVAPKAR